MTRLALLFCLLLTAPAAAQVPCGVVDPCPTATPTPEPSASPTATPTPTPRPDMPVTVRFDRLPRSQTVNDSLTLRGRVDGYRPEYVRGDVEYPLELETYAVRLKRRISVEPLRPDDDGRFELPLLSPQVDTRYIVRVKPGSGLVGPDARSRVVKIFAATRVTGDFSANPGSYTVYFDVEAPSFLRFDGKRRATSGYPRRAWVYVGKGRRLRRVASGRFLSSRRQPGKRTATVAGPRSRLPQGRFRYAACFRGPGARGLTPAFTHCGARFFRL